MQMYLYVNATKFYLHFDCFEGDTILCSNSFSFLIVFTGLISVIYIKLLWLQTWTKALIVCFYLKFPNQQELKLKFAQMSDPTFLHSHDHIWTTDLLFYIWRCQVVLMLPSQTSWDNRFRNMLVLHFTFSWKKEAICLSLSTDHNFRHQRKAYFSPPPPFTFIEAFVMWSREMSHMLAKFNFDFATLSFCIYLDVLTFGLNPIANGHRYGQFLTFQNNLKQ